MIAARPLPPDVLRNGTPLGPAGAARRIGALFLDILLYALAAVVTAVVLGVLISSTGAKLTQGNIGGPIGTRVPAALLAFILQLLVLTALPVYLALGWRRGQTLGMRAAGIRVVRAADGQHVATGQLLLRLGALGWAVPPLFLLGAPLPRWLPLGLSTAVAVAVVISAALGDGRALHDRLAGTRVERWRAPPPISPAWMSPTAPILHTHTDPGPAPDPLAPATEPSLRAWRSLVTAGRSGWTWTDVLPVIALFVPILHVTALGVDHIIHTVYPLHPTALQRGLALLGSDLFSYLGNIALLVLVVRIRRGQGLRDLGWTRVSARWIAVVIPFIAAGLLLEGIASLLSGSLFPGTPENQCAIIRTEFRGQLLVAILATVVAAPIVEETFFRGFLLRWLRDRTPTWVALIVGAALFSVAHFSYHQPTIFLPIFATGLVLGVLYLYSGSIWPGVVGHGSVNLLATLVVLLGGQHC